MKKKQKFFCGIILTVILSILPAMAFAHGGGHHGNRGNHCGQYDNTDAYYYCDGHQAHLHTNGNCPYIQSSGSAIENSDAYYYCNGHQAHLHVNGNCPYIQSSSSTEENNNAYYYCDGYQAHLHANGSCPYADIYSNHTANSASLYPNQQTASDAQSLSEIHAACWQNIGLQNPLMPCYDVFQFTMNYQSALCLGLTDWDDTDFERNSDNHTLCQMNGSCKLIQNRL